MASTMSPQLGVGKGGPTITLRVVQHPIVFGVIRKVDTILYPVVTGRG